MNNRERAMAVLNYELYDRLPVVHFGFWYDTLDKWAEEGHITKAAAEGWLDGNPIDAAIGEKLGFDFNWNNCFHPLTGLYPPIETKVLEVQPDGTRKILNADGAVVLEKDDATSIPAEVDHLLKGREAWEEIFLPKLRYTEERITNVTVNAGGVEVPFDEGGREYLQQGEWENPYGVHCGSLYGVIRNWLGLVGSAYLLVDDEPLFDEIIDTVGGLCYRCTQKALAISVQEGSTSPLDFAHFWEDISFKNGPLINPDVFRAKVGPHYKRITDLVKSYGIHIISLDSDGKIDELIPIWFENGVNTMFPIEVGTWGASIKPWREQYGRELRGVGGMNKVIFSRDYAAVDAEIERLKSLVDLGGYIPCPDHRLAPDAKWGNVQYYCDRMRQTFG